MALIPCAECGRQISDRATACPNCGAPPRAARTAAAWHTAQASRLGERRKFDPWVGGGGVLVAGIVLTAVVQMCSRDSRPSQAPDAVALGPLEERRHLTVAPNVANTLPAPSPWLVSRDPAEMDDSPTFTAVLLASDPFSNSLGQEYIPMLILRCRERKTDVFVRTGMQPHVEYGKLREATVRLRFDRSAAITQVWRESTSGEALGSPNPITLARRIARTSVLRFEFTPFMAGRQTVRFVLRDAAAQVKALAETCRWT